MKTSIERFLKATRSMSQNPSMFETEKNIRLFEQFSNGLFNTEFVEIYSSNVFPEIIKYKSGDRYLLWDSAYWNIFYNIIIMYFMAINAKSENLCEWIKQQLEAEIYYFLALKNWDEIELSLEFSRSYQTLKQRTIQIETTIEDMELYRQYVYEVGFIAKVFCLFHELNHLDNLDEYSEFSGKITALTKLYKSVDEIFRDDSAFLSQLRQYYSNENIYDSLLQIIENKNYELEIELTCDLAALNDTVDFFENLWSNLSKEAIFCKVNEVIIVFNSINFALTQTYKYWNNNYRLFTQKISPEKYYKNIKSANQEAILRYVLSDVVKAIQAYDLYGEKIDELLNTDEYGLRYQAENAFIEEVANNINTKEHFDRMCVNISGYKNVSEKKLEELRAILLEW